LEVGVGADWFVIHGEGETAKEAFNNAREQALYDYGHRGYTGSLAEKTSFREVFPRDGETWDQCVRRHDEAGTFDDKWGPAGAVKVTDGVWCFFGWASS
jgi:hypothetical protein